MFLHMHMFIHMCMLLARQGSWLLPTRFTGDSPVVWPLVIPWVLVATVLMGKWNGQRLAVAAGGCGCRDGI